jgi:SAM-dependent methyltransferase
LRFPAGRAALFDRVAAHYDRFRPAYPDVSIDTVVSLSALRPRARLLEVGCGTGQATVQFADRGYTIDCVDPGANLVAHAVRNCSHFPRIRFTVSTFEKAPLPPRRYDLVYSAHAFHWVSPAVRMGKAARLLAPGGSLALLYNYPGRPEEKPLRSLGLELAEESRGKLGAWDYMKDIALWKAEIAASGLFRDLTVCRRRWFKRYTAEEYVGLYRTYTDFLCLAPDLQEKLARKIHRAVSRNGGWITRPYDCLLIHARTRKGGGRVD